MFDNQILERECNSLNDSLTKINECYNQTTNTRELMQKIFQIQRITGYSPEIMDLLSSNQLTFLGIKMISNWFRTEVANSVTESSTSIIDKIDKLYPVSMEPVGINGLVKHLFNKCYVNQSIIDTTSELNSDYVGPSDSSTFYTCESDVDSFESNELVNLELMESNTVIDQLNRPYITLYRHQDYAIKMLEMQRYKSGVIIFIMGSGKTLIFLASIQKHYEQHPGDNSIYVIICNRKEILSNIFYEEVEEVIIEDNERKVKKTRKLKENHINSLQNSGIFNYYQYTIVDLVDLDERKKGGLNQIKDNRPAIIMVNTQYLMGDNRIEELIGKYEKRIAFVIYDECHNVTGPKFYENVLKKGFKKSKIPIIGYSATPLREVKGAEHQLIDIFGNDDGRLNVIATYDLINGLQDGTILPFKFYLYKSHIALNNKDTLSPFHKRLVKKGLDRVLDELPYKKIICWVKNAKLHAGEWKEFFDHEYGSRFKIFRSDYKCTKDSRNHTDPVDELDLFMKEDATNCILLVVNKCREGSDIPKLDCGIYLNFVKKRSTLVKMQTSGRTCRTDPTGKKEYGTMIDFLVVDNKHDYQCLTVKQIVDYYKKITNLSSDNSDERYNRVLEIFERTNYEIETGTISISVDDNSKHNTIIVLENQIDWNIFKKELKNQIDSDLKVIKNDYSEYLDFKKKVQQYHIKNKFDYDQKWLQFGLYDLKDGFKIKIEPSTKYPRYFKNWYEFLNRDTSKFIKTIEEWKKRCLELQLNSHNYLEASNNHEELPDMPCQFYQDFTNLVDYLDRKIINRRN